MHHAANNAGTEFVELCLIHHPQRAELSCFSLIPTVPHVAKGQKRTFIHYQKGTLGMHLEPSQKVMLSLPFFFWSHLSLCASSPGTNSRDPFSFLSPSLLLGQPLPLRPAFPGSSRKWCLGPARVKPPEANKPFSY